MKEYSKGIYVKFKPEEVEILHDRMKEAGVQNMSAYIKLLYSIKTLSLQGFNNLSYFFIAMNSFDIIKKAKINN